MKLKLFTIGLLATLALGQAEAAQKFQQQRQAVKDVPVLQAQAAGGGAHHPNLDTPTHGDNATAIGDLHAKLGASVANTGPSANHRITDLHTSLGHAAGGAANDPANKKVEDAVALIQPGQPLHTGIVNLNTLLGPGGGNDAHGKATRISTLLGAVHPTHALGGAVPNIIQTKLAAILARLKAGITANAAVAVLGTGGGAVANLGVKTGGGGGNTITTAADIETVLEEMGW